jgi:methionyl-tRNA formyltransferase
MFLGTPDFAVPSLQALMREHEVCAVFTQPDRPSGRGQKLQAPPIKQVAEAAGLRVHQPEKVRNPENRPLFEAYHPDCIVVVAYGQILPGWLLQIPKLGCVNVHGSLLPKYRGAAPIQWSIIRGDRVTGITTMRMDENLDTGPMLLKKEVEIPPEMSAGQLAEELAQIGAALLMQTLEGLENGAIPATPQDDTQATLAPRISKENACIQWDSDPETIHNLIRGLNPWPLAWTDWRETRVQILRSSPPDESRVQGHPPGTFWGTSGAGMKVVCGEGRVLEILEVLPAGKKKISGREYASGSRLKPGDLLPSCRQKSQ